MAIIVSTELAKRDFPDHIVSRDLSSVIEALSDSASDITEIVLNSPEEDERVLSKTLIGLWSNNPQLKVYYICDSGSKSDVLELVVVGMGGVYLNDTYYLSDTEVLDALLDSTPNPYQEYDISSNVVILNSLLKALSSKEEITESRIEVIRSTLAKLENNNKLGIDKLDRLSKSAIDYILEDIREYSLLNQRTLSIIAKYKELREKYNSSESESTESNTTPSVQSSVLYYPRIKAFSAKKVYRVKELSSMKYLTSFIKGFHYWCKSNKHTKPRLIFIENVGLVNLYRYYDLNIINSDTPMEDGMFHDEILVVTHPTEKVMKALMEDSRYDSIIIVDRLHTLQQHIINDKSRGVVFASEGSTLPKQIGIPPEFCINSITSNPRFLLSVSMFQSYPTTESARRSMYAKLSNQYTTLYNFFQKEGI